MILSHIIYDFVIKSRWDFYYNEDFSFKNRHFPASAEEFCLYLFQRCLFLVARQEIGERNARLRRADFKLLQSQL